MGSQHQILTSLGLIYSFVQTYFLSLLMSSDQYWRVVYFCPVGLLLLYIYNTRVNFPYETMRYLLEKGREDEARELGNIIYK